MHSIPTSKLPLVHTHLSEFRTHIGRYWRSVIDKNMVVILHKAFEKNTAAVVMNKALFDNLASRALRIPYAPRKFSPPQHLEQLSPSPETTELSIAEVIRTV